MPCVGLVAARPRKDAAERLDVGALAIRLLTWGGSVRAAFWGGRVAGRFVGGGVALAFGEYALNRQSARPSHTRERGERPVCALKEITCATR